MAQPRKRKPKQRHPCDAPWPPGWHFRPIDHPKLGIVTQIRDGAFLDHTCTTGATYNALTSNESLAAPLN